MAEISQLGRIWYYTSCHTSLKTTPFQVVYGRLPPAIVRFEHRSTTNVELESHLKERDQMLDQIKERLTHAQQLMKNNADKGRRDLQFNVGENVFLKLRPYRQHSVTRRVCQKLDAKYYGPFEVLGKIGQAAYRLHLPPGSKIHPVFHVSQLKPVLGQNAQVNPLPTVFSDDDELVVTPAAILDTRYNDNGYLEGLVQWHGLPSHENSWVILKELS